MNRCRLLRRHRMRRVEMPIGLVVACTRCDFGWVEPRLFAA